MINIGSFIEDFECSEFALCSSEKANLRELLIDKVQTICDENGYEYDWVSNNYLVIIDEDIADSVEEELNNELQELYDNFIDCLAEEEEEEDY